MKTRMLIDARHREETRVAVVKGNTIEEFDFESAEHKQLKGNIYLAKVTRVEPSLQAAFVDYGGNRHGFLAFSEIHPDYYQIPKEDRERLLAEEAAAAAEEAALREQEEAEEDEPTGIMRSEAHDEEDPDFIEVESDDRIDTIDITEGEEPDLEANGDDNGEDYPERDSSPDDDNDGRKDQRGRRRRGRGGRSNAPRASDEARAKRLNLRRRYKIQDVIHRRQVLLVQVVKEERGNKGAALTTYLSLAGRYCVLMPNTSHGGGISRKISSASDRKRLKSIISDLKLPATMGCIIRTAGLARTKPEIKRDFDYLARLWDEIRERTLKGAAPMLIHSDSDLVKRAIRDIYNKDIDDVLVEGADGYKAAKDFMKLLMPSHAKRVQHYADPVSLFQRYGVEDQLNAMYNPVVQLKSGGYIVINPTEALVSIDINSGRSTKEHGIEQTALATNLEAAREIARQLRLRDMAGLVVIDFIDMDHHSNARKVERAMKEALKNDRARIQVGRISSFGLMEMSRQRLRTGVLEASTRVCPHCEGTGLVRTASSSALSALRLIEEESARGHGSQISLQASQEATIYILNNKRAELAEIEDRYHVRVEVLPNGEVEGAKMVVTASGPRPERPAIPAPIVDFDDDDDDIEEIEDEVETDEVEERAEDSSREDRNGKRKRRRRGRRGGRNRERDEQSASAEEGAEGDVPEPAENDSGEETAETEPARKPRRSRGGRRKTSSDPETAAEEVSTDEAPVEVAQPVEPQSPSKPKRASRKAKTAEVAEVAADAEAAAEEPEVAEKPKVRRAPKARAKAEAETVAAATDEAAPAPTKKPRRTSKKADAEPKVETSADGESDESGDGPRRGWWQRTFG
ncbi:MAG TPA: ribonuclease E/G [Sphingorhabdus sp.]|jgi:ribonuclease E|uniref:Rne/Rng family ribonuclease n=1 Tax=Sphingorhabdus sp. TaxID=1902408 RepID=UPI002D17FB6C|nr:ribonuclease E/G [Sphingorhabdus sp.]HMT40593.1 ribonuclease E/G [Sphingorhabdus sp.]HMU22651.1 ribonuclease E/G [Sphingorhabdus sp.]